MRNKGLDKQTGVIVSPLFIPQGGELTFRVGGGGGPDTYVALCTADGTEVQMGRGINSQVMQKASWDLTPYSGKKLFIKIVDRSTSGWGHVTVDDFQFDGEILRQHPGIETRQNSRSKNESATSGEMEYPKVQTTYSQAKGIGAQRGVMRRDPSDIIKVGDRYYPSILTRKLASRYQIQRRLTSKQLMVFG